MKGRRLFRITDWNTGLLSRGVQLLMFASSGFLAFCLRFDFNVPPGQREHLAYAVVIWMCVKAIVFHFHGLGRGLWRFVSLPDLVRLGSANVVGSACSGLVILAVFPHGFPRSIYILDCALCLLATAGIRAATRIVWEVARSGKSANALRCFIYGAGDAGVMLLRELRSNPSSGYRVLGFIDDDRTKTGTRIQGVPVLGRGAELPTLACRSDVVQVLIAIPSATGRQMAAILERCHAAAVNSRTVPSLSEVLSNQQLMHQVRDVAVEDLLGRTPIRLNDADIRAKLTAQTVLVTGAGGSIGSELCRQIARFQPAAIVGYEIAETALFYIEREMRERFPDVRFCAEIGSIQNTQRLFDVFGRHAPAIVYHAAAYKHVPLMEAHVFEAVENNVFGTYNVALAASESGVRDFVMISSDKAVRPTSIMGATKRTAEILISSLQNHHTNYVSVRFGNVLGSNGSVVQLFREQIAAGGPVQITHPAMKRYFMTIPEAAQLVLQASAVGQGGDILVLEMGEPVKIVDLARNMIMLSGFRPEEDIKIEYTGVRPGERLYEELNTLEEDTYPTRADKIRIFAGRGLPLDVMMGHLEAFRSHCGMRNARGLILELKKLVPEYNPSLSILSEVMEDTCPPLVRSARAGA